MNGIFPVVPHSRLAVLLVFLITCLSCNNEAVPPSDSTELFVLCSTGMIADAAIHIGKEKVQVEALMGPGVDPHFYKASQSDLQLLRNADLILYNGLKLEGKMEHIFEKLSESGHVVSVSDGIEREKLIVSADYANTYDPHIWFDVALWTEAVHNIGRALQKADSQNAEFYKRNTEEYVGMLRELHDEIGKKISEIPEDRRILITTHDAFHYFSRAYNIRVEALQGISTTSDIGLKDISRVVELLIETPVPAVFVESSVSSKSLQAVIEGCREKNKEIVLGGTLYADAMGAKGTDEGTYIGMIKYNVTTICDALMKDSENDN